MGTIVETRPASAPSGFGPQDRIDSAKVIGQHRLLLTYLDGAQFELDFEEEIAAGGVMTALADPAVFAAVQVVRRGRAIEFPGEIDFCADSLRLDGKLNLGS